MAAGRLVDDSRFAGRRRTSETCVDQDGAARHVRSAHRLRTVTGRRGSWHSDYTGPDDLPQGANLHDWAFLELPEPSPGLAEQRFRHKWLNRSILELSTSPSSQQSYSIPYAPAPNDLNGVIYQIGITLNELKRIGHTLTISSEETKMLGRFVDEWCDMRIPSTIPGFSKWEPTQFAVIGLGSILSEVRLNDSTAVKIYNKIEDLHGSNIPAYQLILGLLKIPPNCRDELVMLMRMGLVTDDVDFVAHAAVGLYEWLRATTDSSLQLRPPPDDLIREIGVTIATRRKGMLDQSLQIADWIFLEGTSSQKGTIRDFVVQGLSYLLDELRYDRRVDHSSDEIDIPRLRRRCAKLAVTLSRTGVDNPAVTRWMDSIGHDPLPEVRYMKPVNYAPRTVDQAQDNPRLIRPNEQTTVRKKLIEVALPLDAINAAAAREKSIRHGHPSTLHLWWARRPLAAARAVIFAQMVDDPSSRPELFKTAKEQDRERERLFRLIEELVKWENTTNETVLNAARDEIRESWRRTCADNADHPRVADLFDPERLPAFHDPFAGGGALPLEAQRLGLEAHASDLNPVAVLINKAMIEIPPKLWRQASREPGGSVSPWLGCRRVGWSARLGGRRAALWARDAGHGGEADRTPVPED